jgi:hypothetical protein
MSEALVREDLRKIAGELMAARRRLLEMANALPELSEETAAPEGEDDPLVALRATIECVITDSLSPAIAALLAASED